MSNENKKAETPVEKPTVNNPENRGYTLGDDRIKRMSKALDDAIKSGVVEPFDDDIFRFVLKQADHHLAKYVPPGQRDELEAAIDAVLAGDNREALEQTKQAVREVVGQMTDILIDKIYDKATK